MPRIAIVLAGLALLPFAGCLGATDDPAPGFNARPITGDSQVTFTVDRASDLTYDQIVLLANDKPFRFGPRADFAQGWFEVKGKDRPDAEVRIGDEIKVPLAGQVQVEFRRADNGDTLQQWDLTVPDTIPPGAPGPLKPASAETSVPRQAYFQWTSDGDPAGVTYQVEYWTKLPNDANGPAKTITGLLGLTYTVPESDKLLPSTAYGWHVRAVDNAGNTGPWSPEWQFTTAV